MVGLFTGGGKVDSTERERAIKRIIEETDKQIAELRSNLDKIQVPEHRKRVEQYLLKLLEKKAKLEDGSFYKT
jgi:hypothetical protein